MSVYTPDDWKILKIIPVDKNFPSYYRILCSWSGSYLYGASWKASSGIKTFDLNPDGWYYSDQSSGSVYKLHPQAERMSGIMASILSTIMENSKEFVSIQVLELDKFLEEFE